MKLSKKKVIILVSSVVLLLLIGVLFVIYQSGPFDKSNGEDKVVNIPMGSTVNNVADILKENNLIKNELIFKINFKMKNNYSHMKSGKYLLNQKLSNSEIIDKLVSGEIYQDGIKVTIPEGSTSNEIIAILVKNELGKKEDFEELVSNPSEFYDDFEFLNQKDIKSLEGFLYPSTYYFDKDAKAKDIIKEMLTLFNKNYTDELKKKQKERGMTLQEVVNLASIVEKEAVIDEDRPIIASVFYNRLDQNMALQSDATLQYIFETRKKSITYNDLKIDSPYNTYVEKGLPPTPIANPCIKSIEAVLEPANTDYLYFVASIDGGNVYSKTYEEHKKNVSKYRKDRDERNKALEEASKSEKE
ncbi:endolytic transglycosylase MltG [Intestinibacter bartlettii]|uniref:Endolytic murein transglycosylase n=2 Tax=Intestinibacter bartlettii TaxID=261299 RepID=A0ABS6DTG9_9FIRM|nr:endolytic transglycosylase MltG [Intestinibacter bartlettii]MBU5335136.1 endolytic transglycosylase MltG [Intestinibacter bartlettii]